MGTYELVQILILKLKKGQELLRKNGAEKKKKKKGEIKGDMELSECLACGEDISDTDLLSCRAAMITRRCKLKRGAGAHLHQ